MPATAALSRLLLNAVRQGINPARSCLLRPNLATSTATPSLASQWRLQSTATAATTDKDLDVHISGGPKFSHLRDRSVMRVYGTDAADLIQGLVANDVNVLNDEKVMYTMFLSSSGRVLYDVMVYRYDEAGLGRPSEQCFLIECDKSVTTDLQRHMVVYRVRKKADVSWVGDKYQVWTVFDPDSNEDTPVVFNTDAADNVLLRVNDPRIRGFGQRILTESGAELTDSLPDCTQCPLDWYAVHRYRWGVPEGVIDLPPAEALPLESNLAYMNGVSFTKGCYLGQELTARTHHTGVIRKRIMPLEITGGSGLLTPGSVITTPDGKDCGRARGHMGQYGLGLMRVKISRNSDHLKANLTDGHQLQLQCYSPDWWVGKHD